MKKPSEIYPPFRAETSPVRGPGHDSSSKHHSFTGPNSTQLFFGTRPITKVKAGISCLASLRYLNL